MRYFKEACTVFVDEKGQQMIKTPNGEILRAVVSTIVRDNVNEMPTVTVEMYCNLEPTINEPGRDCK